MSYFQLPYVHWSIAVLGLACLGTAACYSLLTLTAVLLWRLRRPTLHPRIMPPVTLLKPLCGAEHGLYERLRTFCQQNYREFQIVFGVRDPTDPALIVVQRLRQEFPSLPIDVVATPQLHGSNYKISNLINMVARARHDVLIIADSTRVAPYSLQSIADYAAMVSLTRMAQLENCAPLPSITDLLASGCATPAPEALTAADRAYLKALYSANLEQTLNLERGDVHERMMRQIEGQ